MGLEYDGRFVDDEIVRIANALKANTTVEGFDLEGMRDKIGQRGALALGKAMSLNRTIAYVDLRQQAFEYNHKRMALFLKESPVISNRLSAKFA